MKAALAIVLLLAASLSRSGGIADDGAGQRERGARLDRAAGAVASAPDPLSVAREAVSTLGPALREEIVPDASPSKDSPNVRERRALAERLRVGAASASFAAANGAAAEVAAIQRDPAYSRGPDDSRRGWLGRIMEIVIRWLRRLTGGGSTRSELPELQLPPWLIPMMWIVIAVGIALASIPLVRVAVRRAQRAKRRKAGLLESEPERTRDEYLALADELAGRGEFRLALRMLYLATLKRFDESRVARFDRGETNWEHLRRIAASPRLPEGLDFRPATLAFDLHWYGGRPADAEVYARFQGWYAEVERRLRESVAEGPR